MWLCCKMNSAKVCSEFKLLTFIIYKALRTPILIWYLHFVIKLLLRLSLYHLSWFRNHIHTLQSDSSFSCWTTQNPTTRQNERRKNLYRHSTARFAPREYLDLDQNAIRFARGCVDNWTFPQRPRRQVAIVVEEGQHVRRVMHGTLVTLLQIS